MKQCPFCLTSISVGATVCKGCGAFEQPNAVASSALKKYFYMVGIPMMSYQLVDFTASAPFWAGLIKPGSTIVNVVSTILIFGYLWKFYLPWANTIMWYRKH